MPFSVICTTERERERVRYVTLGFQDKQNYPVLSQNLLTRRKYVRYVCDAGIEPESSLLSVVYKALNIALT